VGALAKSTLLRKLNAGDVAGAGREFARWTKAKGLELAGLVRRRAAERALFEASA
jgi:lysozyme